MHWGDEKCLQNFSREPSNYYRFISLRMYMSNYLSLVAKVINFYKINYFSTIHEF